MSRDSLNDILNSVNIRRGAIRDNYALKARALDRNLKFGVDALASLDILNENRLEKKELKTYAEEFNLTWNKKSKKYEGSVGINGAEEPFGITPTQLKALKTYDDGTGIMGKVIDTGGINPRYHLDPAEPVSSEPSWIKKLSDSLFSKKDPDPAVKAPDPTVSPATSKPVNSTSEPVNPTEPARPIVPVESEDEFFDTDIVVEDTDFDVFGEWEEPAPIETALNNVPKDPVINTTQPVPDLKPVSVEAYQNNAVKDIVTILNGKATNKEMGGMLANYKKSARMSDKAFREALDKAYEKVQNDGSWITK